MMNVKHKLQMDLAGQALMPRADVVEQDQYARQLELELLCGGESWEIPADAGVLAGGVFRQELSRLPLRLTVNGYWFRTDSYDARIYCHEPSVLYAYSLPAFYGKGLRLAANVSYTFRRRWTLQAKYGWTHYRDRDHIGSGTEEIQGSDKTDLLVQLRLKW